MANPAAVYFYNFLKIANKNHLKIGFELAFTCTYASDNDDHQPSNHDNSGGGDGYAVLRPLFQISLLDAWRSSRLTGLLLMVDISAS